jgi:thiol-disulfide isomerase/thioredoxin
MQIYSSSVKTLVLTIILGSLIGCSIDDVTLVIPRGDLSIKAVNLFDTTEVVAGDFLLSPGGTYTYPNVNNANPEWLTIPDILDTTNYSIDFIPGDPNAWHTPGTKIWKLDGQDADSVAFLVLPKIDSLFFFDVHSITHNGEELTGLPIILDGEIYPSPAAPEYTPAVVQFTSATSHLLQIGSSDCVRGDSTFIYIEEPVSQMVIYVEDAVVDIDLGNPAAELILNLQLEDTPQTGSATLINPAGQQRISAYLENWISSPTQFLYSSICSEDYSFSWTAIETGFDEGESFPDFTLQEAQIGIAEEHWNSLSLRQFRGGITLVNFWFVDCPACQTEMPLIQDLLETYGDSGFNVLALNPLISDDVPDYMESNPDYDFHFLMDTVAPQVAFNAGIVAFPVNFLVGPGGSIRLKVDAIEDIEELELMIESILAE